MSPPYNYLLEDCFYIDHRCLVIMKRWWDIRIKHLALFKEIENHHRCAIRLINLPWELSKVKARMRIYKWVMRWWKRVQDERMEKEYERETISYLLWLRVKQKENPRRSERLKRKSEQLS